MPFYMRDGKRKSEHHHNRGNKPKPHLANVPIRKSVEIDNRHLCVQVGKKVGELNRACLSRRLCHFRQQIESPSFTLKNCQQNDGKRHYRKQKEKISRYICKSVVRRFFHNPFYRIDDYTTMRLIFQQMKANS
mgnify:FL=1